MTFALSFFEAWTEGTGIDPELAIAIAKVESGLDADTVRYEPGWKYHLDTARWAKAKGITRETEKVLQSMSWGLMQIMGTVARELGFDGHLTELTNPNLNVLFGVRKLQRLSQKYGSIEEVVSAYNQGWPRRSENGEFVNQAYVSKVMGFYRAYSSIPWPYNNQLD